MLHPHCRAWETAGETLAWLTCALTQKIKCHTTVGWSKVQLSPLGFQLRVGKFQLGGLGFQLRVGKVQLGPLGFQLRVGKFQLGRLGFQLRVGKVQLGQLVRVSAQGLNPDPYKSQAHHETHLMRMVGMALAAEIQWMSGTAAASSTSQ